MLWISAAVFLIVVVLMATAIARRRRTRETNDAEPRWGEPFVVVAGVLLPAVILVGVFVVSVRDMNAISRSGNGSTLTVQVVGRMWWWEARYPGGAVTANEIHIPTGQPVRFEVSTADVIHSFWVPQLAPKIDMIPGRTNSVTVEADTPGRYRGQCAEFCGLQHANMAFFVVAQPLADFETWLRAEGTPAVAPAESDAAAGMRVFLDSSCVGCHTIRGTDADGSLGPDLTHLASRDTIAAGTLPNDAAVLERWITDPQGVKPGADMPPTRLSPQDLRALVAYLESLG